MKTFSAKPGQVERGWFVIDLENKVLGRAATEIAMILRGKNKPTFTPHEDVGDFVIVINAAKVLITGRKMDNKMYYTHTSYPGGLHSINLRKLLQKRPEEVILHAVKGMLPKTNMGRRLLKKLKVYPGPEHPHTAQRPVPLSI